jgi:aminopeptidase
MVDKQKLQKLAKTMIGYSVKLKPGEKLLLRGYGFDSYPLIKELYREAMKAGASDVAVRFSRDELSRIFFEEASDKQLKRVTALDKKVADSYDAMIQIIADQNLYELTDVPVEKLRAVRKSRKPLSDILHKKKWCLFYYPNAASAMRAKRSLEEWEDFVLDSCLLDWPKVEKIEKKFINLMLKVKKVRIVGVETDLEVEIGGQKWRACCGQRNLPDGEIFTGPKRKGVNGVIRYNTPSHYSGHDFEWVKLWLENGKVVKEESDNLRGLQEILDTDKGSRFYGEFAFGLNEMIKKPTKMILFDEKMGKSLHMALGKCYKECPNGNDSSIHWDLIFRFKQARAKLYFDGKLVFEKGKWIDRRFAFLNKGI